MKISPLSIEQAGPGIDLSEHPDGYAIRMSDPVRDLEYSLNKVTFVFDLAGYEDVRLGFEALEYGDEPHFPKDEFGIENSENLVGFGPFADDVDFDGVAVSVDGVDWYELSAHRSVPVERT